MPLLGAWCHIFTFIFCVMSTTSFVREGPLPREDFLLLSNVVFSPHHGAPSVLLLVKTDLANQQCGHRLLIFAVTHTYLVQSRNGHKEP